jgi:citronellyl-CoA dehydrogenase
MTVAVAAATEFPYFTEEHDMIRQTVKRFCREEIAPFAEEWDLAGIFPRELFKKAANLGLFGIRIDPEWGGSGDDWWASTAYMEAMAWAESGSVNMALMVQSESTIPVLAELGNDEQKQEFLRPAVAGDIILALGISEPGGGSDVAALTTQARIDGNDLVISGQKLWISDWDEGLLGWQEVTQGWQHGI